MRVLRAVPPEEWILSEHAVGDTLSFELERDGRTGTIDLTLEEYSPAAAA